MWDNAAATPGGRGALYRLELESVTVPGVAAVSLRLEPGECVGLSGASGTGKTRLLRAIADLDPHGGTLRLDGVEAAAMRPAAWRRAVGLLPAESAWWAERVRDHFPGPADPTALGLDADILGRAVTGLSSGERQRLALLRLLANQPRVLLLDEPTANLDTDNAAAVEALIAEWRQARGVAVVWVTHDAAQRARVADRRFRVGPAGLERLDGEDQP